MVIYHPLFLIRNRIILNNVTEFLPEEIRPRHCNINIHDSSLYTTSPGSKHNLSGGITPNTSGTHFGKNVTPNVCSSSTVTSLETGSHICFPSYFSRNLTIANRNLKFYMQVCLHDMHMNMIYYDTVIHNFKL